MLMGKRSSHGALGLRLAEPGCISKVERWSPPPTWGEDREQGYLHRVRPQSDGQRRLMEAIEGCHLTIALGPARPISPAALRWRLSKPGRSAGLC